MEDNNNANDTKPRKKKRIDTESDYFTISSYVVLVILISLFLYRIIIHWESTSEMLKFVGTIVAPYFIGFLLAYLLNPMVNMMYDTVFTKIIKIKKHGVKWAVSIAVSYIFVFGTVTLSISFIIPQLIKSITDLLTQLPDIANRFVSWLDEYVYKNHNVSIDRDTVTKFTNDYLPNLQKAITSNISNLIPAVYGVGVSFVKFLINTFIALIVSIYLIIDKRRIKSYLAKLTYALFSKEHSESFFTIIRDCNSICKSFFIGKTIDSLIIGTLCLIIMSIVRLPYAVLISVIVAITNMIPYFGPYIGAIPCIIILLIDKPSYGIAFGIIILALQTFDGWILGPKILGNSTGLRPIVILFAISVGGAVAGPLGMFLGVPAFGILSYLMDKFIAYRLNKKNIVIKQ